MCCSVVLRIRLISMKGKTVVVDVVVVVVVVNDERNLSLDVDVGDGIVLRNDSAT
jgi:hypothetical protein